MNQDSQLKKGDAVWVVERVPVGERGCATRCVPVQRIVNSVGSDSVHLEGSRDRKFSECYVSRMLCEFHCRPCLGKK